MCGEIHSQDTFQTGTYTSPLQQWEGEYNMVEKQYSKDKLECQIRAVNSTKKEADLQKWVATGEGFKWEDF